MKCRGLGLAALLLAALPLALPAQYFGRNRVQYGRFDFSIIQTEHFDVYFYPAERQAAFDVARMAERAYTRLSRALSHQFTERKPIIVYASHSEFQQTNTSGGEVDESTGGFTDFLRHRNVFPLTGAYAENEHVLMHEMVHQFQFDIWSRGRGAAGVQGILSVNAPLWYAEGMAEYFSLGPVDPNTAMVLRDAALEGKLPSPQDFYRFFPYRFGHALLAYIGGRWGDEAIGQLTRSALGGGVEGALRRVLGINFEQLVAQWQDAVQKQYLPEIGNRAKARAVAAELLTEKRSDGTLHLAPALSPDGALVAYFSEKDFYFVDLYLADAHTGKVIRRLLKSSYSSNYETFRFINSSSSWSPDGRYLAFAAKTGGKDDLVIIDPRRNRQVRQIKLPLNGATTPAWSPDGSQLVFTGQDGGLSDLYVVNADGTGLRRLTNDKEADLHPVWSPDGKTIAFVTDRGPTTDFGELRWGNFRIGLLRLEDGRVETPAALGAGRNTSPQWSPDGKALAFVSDRNGVNNLYLYETAEDQAYQLTDFYTGISGITPLSPVLSWASGADRLAFVYFEQGKYDVYTLANPRAAKREPWKPGGVIAQYPLARIAPPLPVIPPVAAGAPQPAGAQVLSGGAVYRAGRGFRRADSLPELPDSLRGAEPISIARILDSMPVTPPDTAEFVVRPYKVRLEPEALVRPTIGYTRDNFGRGVTGSAAILLGDMLGNHQMIFGASLNGRINETQFLGAYINASRRTNWGLQLSQDPYFFYDGSGIEDGPRAGERTLVTQYRRLIFRQAGGVMLYPFNRFRRLEFGVGVTNVEEDIQQLREPYDPLSGARTADPFLNTINGRSNTFVQPTLALVFDNTLFGSIGPFLGRRSRLEVAPRFGGWTFTSLTADFRRYDGIVGPIMLATRLLYFGHHGRDESLFRFYGGYPDLIRGYTSGSFGRNECSSSTAPSTVTGCAEADQLVGTRMAAVNAEIRFPLVSPVLGFPAGLPRIEGVLFWDAGLVYEDGNSLKLSRDPGDSLTDVRVPLQSIGFGFRTNVFNFVILRVDYAIPQSRPGVGGLWTLSLGPAF